MWPSSTFSTLPYDVSHTTDLPSKPETIRLLSLEHATAFIPLPKLRVKTDLPTTKALVIPGISGKWLLHPKVSFEFRGHVASPEI